MRTFQVLTVALAAACAVQAQEADPLTQFVSDTAVPEPARVEPLQTFLLDRVPPLAPPNSAEEWEAYAALLRKDYRDNLVLRGVPDAWRAHDAQVEWTDTIATTHGYKIRKLRYEALPGLWIPALLYEPDVVDGRVPAILNVNGHSGAPGKASPDEQLRCINLAKRGMLALHPEWLTCGELVAADYAHGRLAYLDLVGVSGLSVFHYLLERALDILVNDPRTDPERVAMTGLSGGGWQTTVFSAVDERVRVIVPNAGHSGFALRVNGLRNMGDLEQAPVDLLTIADYTHLTALFAPRPALLIYNAQDNCCFTASEALPTVYDPALPVYEAYGRKDDFTFHINEDPGTHNYDRDNRVQFYAFIERYFLPDAQRLPDEIPSDDEVLTPDALVVGLPENNATFDSLALAIAEQNQRPAYASPDDAIAKLKEITRFQSLQLSVERATETDIVGLHATACIFTSDYGPFYGLLLETEAATPKTVVHVADAPIAESLPNLRESAAANGRVLAIEPLLLGANQPGGGNAWQYGMALQAAGERLLGIQAAEIIAACNWAAKEFAADELHLETHGPLSGTAATIAAALTTAPPSRLSVHGGLQSLLDPVRNEVDWGKNQALFCFGLQSAFEIDELEAIIRERGTAIEHPNE